MAFVAITDPLLKDKDKHPPIPFVSVNIDVGGYFGGGLYALLGKPDYVELEYDADTHVLRFRAGESHDSQVKNQAFRLPENVRRDMTFKRTKHFRTTCRHNVVERDGWWYTDGVQAYGAARTGVCNVNS